MVANGNPVQRRQAIALGHPWLDFPQEMFVFPSAEYLFSTCPAMQMQQADAHSGGR